MCENIIEKDIDLLGKVVEYFLASWYLVILLGLILLFAANWTEILYGMGLICVVALVIPNTREWLLTFIIILVGEAILLAGAAAIFSLVRYLPTPQFEWLYRPLQLIGTYDPSQDLTAIGWWPFAALGVLILLSWIDQHEAGPTAVMQHLGLGDTRGLRRPLLIGAVLGTAAAWGLFYAGMTRLGIETFDPAFFQTRLAAVGKEFFKVGIPFIAMTVFVELLRIRILRFWGRRLNQVAGTVIVAALFGFLALLAPVTSPLIVAGFVLFSVFMARVYYSTKSAWFAAGFACCWDIVLRLFLGLPNQGLQLPSVVTLPDEITKATVFGGINGPEGSLIGLAVIAVAWVLWSIAVRSRRWFDTRLPVLLQEWEKMAKRAEEQRSRATT